MTIESIMEAEAQVTDRVTLYYEGMFWKAYERSAFLVCSQIRAFKPTKKFVKKMGGREVVSIGFPDTSLETLMQGRQKASESHISRTYAGFRPLNEQEFIQWKNKRGALPCIVAEDIPEEENDDDEQKQPQQEQLTPIPEVIQRIKEFDLLNHSPYDCMIFVKNLKELLA